MKQIVRMLAFVAIMLLLMPLRSMAVKIPVAILRTNADGKTKTLTFTYAERPKVFAKRGQNGIHKILQYVYTVPSDCWPNILPTWVSKDKNGDPKENQPITNVVFNKSFAMFKPVSTFSWFCSLDKLTSIKGIENLNTTNVKSMTMMFENCKSLTSIDLSGFNTRNVEHMGGMFLHCSSLRSIDISRFNTSNVKDMSSMFCGCSSLTRIDLSGLSISNVDMSGMFEDCSSLKSINLSGLNPSGYLGGMFKGCSSLTNIDLSGFNTSEVNNMSSMFEGCSSLISIDLTGFNTSKVEKVEEMFKDCSKLSVLNISNFDIQNMFRKCIKELATPSYDGSTLSESLISNYANDAFKNVFQGCSSLMTLYIGHNDFNYVDERFETDSFFVGIGTPNKPCRLVVDSNFNKSTLVEKRNNDVNKPVYNWLGGYFTLDNSTADARP